MELKHLFRDKKFWFASFLIAWAAGLQGHMMWLQRQEAFKQKFGTLDETEDTEHQRQKFGTLNENEDAEHQMQEAFKQQFGTLDENEDA